MDSETFINAAIDTGAKYGIDTLDAEQRLVFLISEAEVLCDMEGIESFLQCYGPIWIAEAAAAFEAVGAVDIAAELRVAPIGAPVGDPRLSRLNELITSEPEHPSVLASARITPAQPFGASSKQQSVGTR
jgi:hypothetical protein